MIPVTACWAGIFPVKSAGEHIATGHTMNRSISENRSAKAILINMLLATGSLFLNGFGVFLTIHADIGAAPWDVFNLGLSKTLGILYGNVSISVSLAVLLVDILMKEPIGIAMFIDTVVVGKAVDFFDRIRIIPAPKSFPGSVIMMLTGLWVMGYTQFFYMSASLGCGPRDTLLVGLKKRLSKIPIGVVSIFLLGLVTLIGSLLGGKVGIGTLICAFGTGPIMQFAFHSVHFDAAGICHQRLRESGKILLAALKK